MAMPLIHAVALSFLVADAPASLRPAEKVGESARVVVELKGEGLFKAAPDEAAAASKPRSLKVETRLEFAEKILAVGKDGAATKTIRRVERAGAAINGEVRATSATIRPEVAHAGRRAEGRPGRRRQPRRAAHPGRARGRAGAGRPAGPGGAAAGGGGRQGRLVDRRQRRGPVAQRV